MFPGAACVWGRLRPATVLPLPFSRGQGLMGFILLLGVVLHIEPNIKQLHSHLPIGGRMKNFNMRQCMQVLHPIDLNYTD